MTKVRSSLPSRALHTWYLCWLLSPGLQFAGPTNGGDDVEEKENDERVRGWGRGREEEGKKERKKERKKEKKKNSL